MNDLGRAAYPLWSSDWAIVEHGVLLLWKDVWTLLQRPEVDASLFEHVMANTKVWSTLSSLLGSSNPSVELAVVHCLFGVFSAPEQSSRRLLQRQLQDQLVATHCIENLCVKLISPYDVTDPTSQQTRELAALTMVQICKLPHLVDRVCFAGAMDAFTFLILHDEQSTGDLTPHIHRMQEAALKCITFCVENSMACLEDFEHSDVFVHVLAQYVLDPESPPHRAEVGMTLLSACMNHQPLICKVLVDHGLLHALSPMLQSSTRLQVPALSALKHLFTTKHDTIPRDTAAHLRISGGLIHLGWLAWAHDSPCINRAASTVLTCLMQWAQNCADGPNLVQDLVEQGCVLLLIQRKPSAFLTWLLAELNGQDGSSYHHLASVVCRSNNNLLRMNVTVGMCVASAQTSSGRLAVNEWWTYIEAFLTETSNARILRHVVRVLTTLCNPSTVESPTHLRLQGVPRLPLPTLHGSTLTLRWQDKPNDTVPKLTMMENSTIVATMLTADATCTTVEMPHDLPPRCMPLFLQMCHRTSTQPLSQVPSMHWRDLLELARIAQKLGMLVLLRSVEIAMSKQHLPHHVALILGQAVTMRIPSIVLMCLHTTQSLLPSAEDDDAAAALTHSTLVSLGMLISP